MKRFSVCQQNLHFLDSLTESQIMRINTSCDFKKSFVAIPSKFNENSGQFKFIYKSHKQEEY